MRTTILEDVLLDYVTFDTQLQVNGADVTAADIFPPEAFDETRGDHYVN